MRVSPKNEEAPPPLPSRRRLALPQRSWKSSSELPSAITRWENSDNNGITGIGMQHPPHQHRRSNSDSSTEVDLAQFDASEVADDDDDDDEDDDNDDDDVDSAAVSEEQEDEPISPLKNWSGGNLSRWTSNESLPSMQQGLSPTTTFRPPPTRHFHGSASPHRGVARWHSTSECLQSSSIPEDAEVLTINKKHPADTTKAHEDSLLAKPTRRKSMPLSDEEDSSDSHCGGDGEEEEEQEVEEDNDPVNNRQTSSSETAMPLTRRYRSEIPRRGPNMLLEMQQSLRQPNHSDDQQPAALIQHGREQGPPARISSSRPVPPRRIPSRSVSECVAPLHRSLSRRPSVRRTESASSTSSGGADATTSLMALRQAAEDQRPANSMLVTSSSHL